MSLYSSKHLAILVWFLILLVGITNARVAERDAEDRLDKAATNVSNPSPVLIGHAIKLPVKEKIPLVILLLFGSKCLKLITLV